MEVKFALLAEYSNVTREGKLNLLGLFEQINAPSLPWTHPHMQLVLSLEATPAEWDSHKKIEIKLLDADGNSKLNLSSNLKVPIGQSGRNISINSVIGINNLKFDAAGDYAFHVIIGEDDKRTIPLKVNFTPKSDKQDASQQSGLDLV